MLRFFQRTLLALAVAGSVNTASAFSLLGPSAVEANAAVSWQIPRIGYEFNGSGDIGGPMNIAEEYRWNIKTITYGFDESFRNYFGETGMNEVRKAFAILNSLPSMSKMSADLSEFPTDTRRINYRASALGILDLKSHTLGLLMEQLGLASPERFAFTLRDRVTLAGPVVQYTVVQRNFDPVTFNHSKYVNGVLYTYSIGEFAPPAFLDTFADAVETPVDPLAFGFTSVASVANGLWAGGLFSGDFLVGLTRDDVAGLRYLYRPTNFQYENLITNATGSTVLSGNGTSPWAPVPGVGTNTTGLTNIVIGTNALVITALRPGEDKLNFVEGKYDSGIGNFLTVTNTYKDAYLTNNHLASQAFQRILTQPDIVFVAADLGNVVGVPILSTRTTTGGWANNDALNGQATLGGPGVIEPQVVFSFSKIGPVLFNFDSSPLFLSELGASFEVSWGTFDGTTNEPIIYPDGLSVQDLERHVLGGH